MIKRGSYQEASEDSRWEYEPVFGLWPDIYHDSESSVDGSSDEGIKYQDNLADQEQEVVSAPFSNTRRIRKGYQRALRKLKS